MRILLASSEVHPYSKTGGLGDMVASLGKAFFRQGHEVVIVTPLYRGIREEFRGIKRTGRRIEVAVGGDKKTAELWSTLVDGGETVLFVNQPGYFDRETLYTEDGTDFPDNAERFIFFSKVIAEIAATTRPRFDVIHAHDWQTALVSPLLKHANAPGRIPGVCLTIHNLAYQGVFPADDYALTGLPPDWFNIEGAEFYGKLNCLKAGIATADALTTVSPRYAREITTEEFGCGLDGLLRKRQQTLHGILNGVDYEEWRTVGNPILKAPYDADRLEGKQQNKIALQQEMGLEVDRAIPLFGSVTRLVEQKGMDLALAALEEMLEQQPMQFAQLGSGQKSLEKAFVELAERHPGKVGVRMGYNNDLAHRIEAGSDFFLMPSRFEPCGLNQLYSLRYGTIPIVRAVGGLDDSVVDITESEEFANGIKFYEPSAPALAKGIRKALALYAEPALVEHYRRNGMEEDFSADECARQYLELFESLATAKQAAG